MATTAVLTLADEHEQLLPGIPDEITLGKICTKLPWRDVYVLSSVSTGWQRAARSRQIYEARVRSQSTETLVVFGRPVSSRLFAFHLYSLRENAWYQLPWLSQLEGGRPWVCKCVSLDGRIYAMGRLTDRNRKGEEMCVLDVAGRTGWRNSADMQARRVDFSCGIMDGKIYVVGGTFRGTDGEDHESGSEVYDPDTNAWSSIPPLKSERSDHAVAVMGEELYVYGGYCRTPGAHFRSVALPLEIYHPIKNEWRQVESWSTSKLERLFISHGKLYSVRADGIYVHDDDIEKNSWERVHFLEDTLHPPWLVAAGDELLDFSYFLLHPTGGSERCVRQSKGFASTTKELMWTTIKPCVSRYLGTYAETPRSFMCAVDL